MPFGCSVSMATLSFSMLSAPVDSTACNTKMYQQNYETLYDGKPKKYLSNGYRILVFFRMIVRRSYVFRSLKIKFRNRF